MRCSQITRTPTIIGRHNHNNIRNPDGTLLKTDSNEITFKVLKESKKKGQTVKGRKTMYSCQQKGQSKMVAKNRERCLLETM